MNKSHTTDSKVVIFHNSDKNLYGFLWKSSKNTEIGYKQPSIFSAAAMRQPYNGWAVGLSYYGSRKTTKGTALSPKEMSD